MEGQDMEGLNGEHNGRVAGASQIRLIPEPARYTVDQLYEELKTESFWTVVHKRYM
jgi:hypothetical protein